MCSIKREREMALRRSPDGSFIEIWMKERETKRKREGEKEKEKEH